MIFFHFRESSAGNKSATQAKRKKNLKEEEEHIFLNFFSKCMRGENKGSEEICYLAQNHSGQISQNHRLKKQPP